MGTMYNDEILGISCILSENRKTRPNHFLKASLCPFCPENGGEIEQVICSAQTPDGDQVRIVNNKYPVCSTEDTVYGVHEVLIETDDHDKKPWQFSVAHWETVFQVMQRRWMELSQDPRIHFIQLFKNEGEQAGASISHTHAQIIALEEVPCTVETYYKKIERYNQETGKCRICEEIRTGVVLENMTWQLSVPDGLCFPYETWLMPKAHCSHIGQLSQESIKGLSELMYETMTLYYKMLPDTSYNICFMNGRPREEGSYHFYIKILPRTGNFAGFELATGCAINVIGPKTQRKAIRKILSNIKGDYKSNE